MFLYVTQHILHVATIEVVVQRVGVLSIMMSIASVAVAGGREFHVHYWRLVLKVLRSPIELWRPMSSILTHVSSLSSILYQVSI